MNHTLTLSLRLIAQSNDSYVFVLSMLNNSEVRLLLPYPDLPDLSFERMPDGMAAEWYTSCLVHTTGGGLVLEPGQRWDKQLVAFWQAAEFEEVDLANLPHSWHIELTPGEYSVLFRFTVDSNYFDPDSHWRMPQLQQQAQAQGATVWMGEAISNTLLINHV